MKEHFNEQFELIEKIRDQIQIQRDTITEMIDILARYQESQLAHLKELENKYPNSFTSAEQEQINEQTI